MIKGLSGPISAGWALASRNIGIQVREHALGYAWTLLTPVIYAFCYILVRREWGAALGQINTAAGWDIIRVLAGIMLFQLWIQVLQDMSEMVRRNRGMLRGLNIGPEPFVIAVIFEGLITLVVRSVLIVLAVPVLGLTLAGNLGAWLWFLFALLAVLISAAAIGLALAPWSALYGDVRKALQSIGMPIMLISPIFYPAVENMGSVLYWVNVINPLASPLAVLSSAMRDQPQGLYWLPALLWAVCFTGAIFWLTTRLRKQVPVLLERVGG